MKAVVRGLVLLAAFAIPAPAEEPRAPKLTDEAPPPAAPSAEPGEARALPHTAAVCRDETGPRCWVVEREADCPPGKVFRTVIDDASHRDVEDALVRCRETPRPRRAE